MVRDDDEIAHDADRLDLREAYDRGRRDERDNRRRRPVLMTFLFIAAIAGVVLLGLAAMNGSFSQAGKVVDSNLATAADRAEPMVRGAADDAGDALRDATTPDRDPIPAPPASQPAG